MSAELKAEELRMQLVRLLTYVLNMQEDFPELPWQDLPDQYEQIVWRYAR